MKPYYHHRDIIIRCTGQYLIRNLRSNEKRWATIQTSGSSGSKGDGHGRWREADSTAAGQWQIGDRVSFEDEHATPEKQTAMDCAIINQQWEAVLLLMHWGVYGATPTCSPENIPAWRAGVDSLDQTAPYLYFVKYVLRAVWDMVLLYCDSTDLTALVC